MKVFACCLCLAVSSLILSQPAHAQWSLGAVTYPQRDAPPSGSTYAQSSSRPQVTSASEGHCMNSPSSYGISGATQNFSWAGQETPTSSFYVDATCYARGSADTGALDSHSGGHATFGDEYVGETTAEGQSPDDGDYDRHSTTDTYRYHVDNGLASTSYDVSIDITAGSQVFPTSNCATYPDASGFATATSWVVLSNVQGASQISSIPRQHPSFLTNRLCSVSADKSLSKRKLLNHSHRVLASLRRKRSPLFN